MNQLTEKTKSSKSQDVKFQPLGNRVLLRRLESQEKLKGGILLPDTAKQKQERLKLSPSAPEKKIVKATLMPIPVKVGDIVLMEKYSGQEVTLNDQEYVIVRADDLIAIINE